MSPLFLSFQHWPQLVFFLEILVLYGHDVALWLYKVPSPPPACVCMKRATKAMEGYDVMKMTIISGVCVIATTLNVFFFFIVQERFMSVCIRVYVCVFAFWTRLFQTGKWIYVGVTARVYSELQRVDETDVERLDNVMAKKKNVQKHWHYCIRLSSRDIYFFNFSSVLILFVFCFLSNAIRVTTQTEDIRVRMPRPTIPSWAGTVFYWHVKDITLLCSAVFFFLLCIDLN